MISREKTIEWLRENTTVEDWEKEYFNVAGWNTVRKPWETSRLERGPEVITVTDVFPPASPAPTPASPRTPLFDRIKKTLGSDVTDEDSLVDHINDIATITKAADRFVKASYNVLGDDWNPIETSKRFDSLVAVLDVEPVSTPTPVSPKLDRSKPRNKYDHEIIPGVHVDVYDVLNAFPTGGADIDHAVKKLLQPGNRGHKDEITDCEEAIKSIQRRIDHIKEWGGDRG